MPGGRPMQQWEEANAWRSAILRTNKQQNPLAGRRGFVLIALGPRSISIKARLSRSIVLNGQRSSLPDRADAQGEHAVSVDVKRRGGIETVRQQQSAQVNAGRMTLSGQIAHLTEAIIPEIRLHRCMAEAATCDFGGGGYLDSPYEIFCRYSLCHFILSR
jgi:hypothetical protein